MASYPPLIAPPPTVPGQTPPFAANPQQQVQNAKRDQRRRDGAALLTAAKNVAGQGQPPAVPPPNSTADATPQHAPLPAAPQMGTPTTPVPQYTSPTFTPAKYEPPKKGLEYLALGLSVLFPGSPISKMAAGFAGGLQQGAEQSYQRREGEAEQQYKVASANAQADFQNRLAGYNAEKDSLATKFSNDKIGYDAAVKGLDLKYGNDVAVYNANQDLRARGIDPKTQKPFVLPAALANPPPPTAGYDGLARWHEARASAYGQLGATTLAAQEKADAGDATRQAIDAANNARALKVAADAAAQRLAIHNDTENRADARHSDSEYRADQRALLTDDRQRGVLRDQALVAGKDFFTAYQKLTTAPTKTVEVKDNQGQVIGTKQVPMLGANGQPQAAPISGALQQQLVQIFARIGKDSDPAGAAQFYASAIDNPQAQELLMSRGRAADLLRRSQGFQIIPHEYPKIETPKPKPFSGKLSPEVSSLVTQARKNGKTDDEIRAAMKQDGHSDAEISMALKGPDQPPEHLALPAGVRRPGAVPGVIPRSVPGGWPHPLTRDRNGNLLPPGSYLPSSP